MGKVKIRREDSLFSKYIRNRDKWTCQRCHRTHEEGSRGMHCSHYWSRGKWGTRFDPENCDALCYACHMLWGGDRRSAYTAFKKKQLGIKRYNALMCRAHAYAKRDRKLALEHVNKLLKTLDL